MKYIAIVMALFYVSSVFSSREMINDHYDGKYFYNLGNSKQKKFWDFLKWRFTAKRGPWKDWTDLKQIKSVDKKVNGKVKVTFINHSTFLIQTQNLNILTDPIFSDYVAPVNISMLKRCKPVGLKYENLPKIDLVLISHNHYDHLDKKITKRLVKDHDPFYIVPLKLTDTMIDFGVKKERLHEMDWWNSYDFKGIKITSCPAQHFSARTPFDRNMTLWCSYMISAKKGNIYFGADSGFGEFYKDIAKKFNNIILNLIPIGAYKPKWFMGSVHLNPDEAIQVHKILKAKTSIGMHFGTFKLADDGQMEPLNDTIKARKKYNVSDKEFIIPENGNVFEF